MAGCSEPCAPGLSSPLALATQADASCNRSASHLRVKERVAVRSSAPHSLQVHAYVCAELSTTGEQQRSQPPHRQPSVQCTCCSARPAPDPGQRHTCMLPASGLQEMCHVPNPHLRVCIKHSTGRLLLPRPGSSPRVPASPPMIQRPQRQSERQPRRSAYSLCSQASCGHRDTGYMQIISKGALKCTGAAGRKGGSKCRVLNLAPAPPACRQLSKGCSADSGSRHGP